MKGTEKQVKWAEEIKATAYANVDMWEDHFGASTIPGDALTATLMKILRANLDMIFTAKDDAAWIIDHRNLISADQMMRQVYTWANQIKAGKVTLKKLAELTGAKLD